MLNKILELAHNVITEIITRYNNVVGMYYDMKDNIAEAKYNKIVTDFYENGIGYYGD